MFFSYCRIKKFSVSCWVFEINSVLLDVMDAIVLSCIASIVLGVMDAIVLSCIASIVLGVMDANRITEVKMKL